MIKLTMFDAGNGDCFLCEFSFENIDTNILVDFGYGKTYQNCLKPYFLQMSSEGKIIDLAIVTHIDLDHIGGAIPFFRENKMASSPEIIKVSEIWHNSYRHLSMACHKKDSRQREILKKRSTYIDPNLKDAFEYTGPKQGSNLAKLIKKYEHSWNKSFSEYAICSGGKQEVSVNNIKIIVLSPTETELENLKNVWYRDLAKTYPGIIFTEDDILDDALEYAVIINHQNDSADFSYAKSIIDIEKLAESTCGEDQDPINLSSITFILEVDDKKILFLGDAPSSIVLRQLRKFFPNQKICFDAIKISHHGSKKNNSSDFFEAISCSNYFISSNGQKFGHPDIETIAKLITTSSTRKKKIYISHYQEKFEIFISDDLMKKYNYEIIFGGQSNSLSITL